MKRYIFFVLAFVGLFYLSMNAQAFNDKPTELYENLTKILSDKITINKQELREFDKLIGNFIKKGRNDFGGSAHFYASNIAIVNGSLIVGYVRGKGRNKVLLSDIKAIKEKYDKLYIPLYSHALPFKMITKDPQYVLNYNIIPTYSGLVDFAGIKADFFKLIDLSKIPQNSQLLMAKAITGFACGIALAKGRQFLMGEDIKNAQTISCWYPKCNVMLAEKLFQFHKKYQSQTKKIYFLKKNMKLYK